LRWNGKSATIGQHFEINGNVCRPARLNSTFLRTSRLAVAKSGVEGRGSKQCLRKSITQQQAGLIRRAKTSCRDSADLAGGLLLWQIRCVERRGSVRCARQASKSEIPVK
jgi:hypothetical protein